MDEPSRAAQGVLAEYRRARAVDPDMRARVRDRLARSIVPPRVRVEPARMRVAAVVVLAVAAAAVVVLALGWPRRAVETTVGTMPTQAQQQWTAPRPSAAVVPPVPAELPAAPPAAAPVPEPPPPPAAASVQRGSRPPTEPAATINAGLQRELALLREAKRQLDDGDARAALVTLAEHARSFAAGQLAEDRDGLRIEALCLAGDRAAAQRERTAFERRHPGSTHLSRVGGACE